MADKRIKDLQTSGVTPLSYRIPVDYTGLSEAQYRTIQQLIDIIKLNLNRLKLFSGSTNPDNALGNNDDIYFKLSTSEISFWQKVSGSWDLIASFTLPSVPVNNATTSPLSNATLDGLYPTAGLGAEVLCENITDGPRIYKKMPSGAWMIIFLQFNDAV